jgi:SPP1 family predicted phage head-tail adaptor
MAASLDFGKWKHRISVQSRSSALDAFGQQTSAWSTVATVWADIVPSSGLEKQRAGMVGASLTHSVAVRYTPLFLPAITAAAYRILYGTRVLNITAVMDVGEEHVFILFDCVEGSLDGQ